MTIEELVFWLEWYRGLQAVLVRGQGSVRLDAKHNAYRRFTEDFAPALVELDALFERLRAGPVPEADVSPHAPDPARRSVWPAPELPPAARTALQELVRVPWARLAGAPRERASFPGRVDPVEALLELARLVRHAPRGGEAGTGVPFVTCVALFDAALDAFDFLPRAEVDEMLRAHGLERTVLAPFSAWVGEPLTLSRWMEPESD